VNQTNTRTGEISVTAGENLTGKLNLLAKIANDGGDAIALLPTANADLALFVIVDDNVAGELVGLLPLCPNQNVRVTLKGTCNPGDVLVNADVATPADIGKVRVLPATTGTYRGILIAEESGIDGQTVLARPASLGIFTVA